MDGLRPERQGGYPGQPVGPLQRHSVLLPHPFPFVCPRLAQILSAGVPSAILPSLSILQGKLSETVIAQ